MPNIWQRRDFVQVFVTCPVCGRVWYKRLYSTGAVRLIPADGDWQLSHAACKAIASRQDETLGLAFKGRE